MFMGESSCLLLYALWRWSKRSVVADIVGAAQPVSEGDLISQHMDDPLFPTGYTQDPFPTLNLNKQDTTDNLMELDRRCPWWWWVTPAPLDFFECALGNMATTITYTSTVQVSAQF